MNQDELLIKYITGEADPAEIKNAEEWISADQRNRREYERLQLIWEESKKLNSPVTIDEHQAWLRFQTMVENKKPAARLPISLNWLRVAAILIVLAGATWIYLSSIPDKKENQPTIAENITVNSGNSTRTQILPDGSAVTLNKNSSIFYPAVFKEQTRPVKLQGEGFFTVTPDASKPFIVSVSGLDIKVVGTSFFIRSNSRMTDVEVKTGIVKLIKPNDSTILQPNEFIKMPVNDTTPMKYLVFKKLQSEKVLQFLRDNKKKLIESDTSNLKVRADKQDSAILSSKIKLFNAVRMAGGDTIQFGGVTLDSFVKRMVRNGEVNFSVQPDTSSLESQQYRDIIKNILRDLLEEKVENSPQDIHSFRLTGAEFYVNGKKQEAGIFQKFRNKFISTRKDYGIYYGAEKVTTKHGIHIESVNL